MTIFGGPDSVFMIKDDRHALSYFSGNFLRKLPVHVIDDTTNPLGHNTHKLWKINKASSFPETLEKRNTYSLLYVPRLFLQLLKTTKSSRDVAWMIAFS